MVSATLVAVAMAAFVVAVVAISLVSGTLYAAYQRGHRDARGPDHIVDLREIENFYRRDASIDALDAELRDGGDRES